MAMNDKWAALLAASLAIERFWESIFALFERAALASSTHLGSFAGNVRWAHVELQNAQKAVSAAAEALSLGAVDPAGLDTLQAAEARLVDAQTRIADGLKTP